MEPTSRVIIAEKPSHMGILREETVALRQLLGYGRSTEASLRLDVPELGTNLPGSSMRDVLLVGLDVDTFQGYEELIPDQQLHVGISILDTRRLHELLVSSSREGELATAIDSHQWTIGSSGYCRRARNKFLFGKSKSAASIYELKSELEHLVEGRDIVLVLHGAVSDLKMLRHLNIDLRPLYIIDTNKAAQYPLQLWYRYRLDKLLDVLEIPYAKLHAAGNDARFSLQALLMLAVKDAEMMSQPGAAAAVDNALLRLLKGISQAPRPPTRAEIEAALAPARLAAKEAKAATAARRKQRRAARREQRRLEREARENVAEESETEEPNNPGG